MTVDFRNHTAEFFVMLQWLIIGGGIHGTYLSHVLTSRAGIPRDRVRVLDPQAAPLVCWRTRAANTGMTYLRSPDVHNIDLDPMSMFSFARQPEGASKARFAGLYRNQPTLDFFQHHVDWVVRRHDLTALRVVGCAERLLPYSGGIRIETTSGSLEARHVVLAIGAGEPSWLEWARGLRTQGAPLHHVFDLDFNRASLPPWTHAVVVGGGITAAQTALALAQRAPGMVTMLSRHATREQPFDSDPCWFSSCLAAYSHEVDLTRRRAII
jgi:glycine/D-amino acid oxidase-like deaminating enzyme